jgi:hypothetical protein
MRSFYIVRIHIESVEDKALSLPDCYSTEMFPGEFPSRDVCGYDVTGLVAQEGFFSGPMMGRKSIFVCGAHLSGTMAGGSDNQWADTFDINLFRC